MFEHKRTTSTPSHRTTNPFSWKRTNVSKFNLNQNGNASWCIFIFLPSVLCYHHLTHPVLTKEKKKNNMPNQTCSKNNNSNLKQPRFLVHIHIVPRLWWWYFFPFPPACPATGGMIVVRGPFGRRPDFKTTRIGGGVGGGGVVGGTKMISTNDDEGYEDSIYFQHQPMQPTLPHQQQLQQQQHQTFGRNGGGGGGGGRKEPGHIYNNQ